MLTQTYATATTWLITSNPCSTGATYPQHKTSNSKLLKEKRWSNSNLKLDIPANLQAGVCSAAVYTTKIILAPARASKQQSQPFMVRVGINIAESREWGANQSWECNTFMGVGLCQREWLPDMQVNTGQFLCCAGQIFPKILQKFNKIFYV